MNNYSNCWLSVSVFVNSFKTLMVLLLCLTLVGQTFASTIMSYSMMNMSASNGQNEPHDVSAMDMSTMHDMHQMTEISSSEVDDCCVKACSCFTSSCSSVAVLMADISNNVLIVFSVKITTFSNLVTSQTLKSLYRPPILS